MRQHLKVIQEKNKKILCNSFGKNLKWCSNFFSIVPNFIICVFHAPNFWKFLCIFRPIFENPMWTLVESKFQKKRAYLVQQTNLCSFQALHTEMLLIFKIWKKSEKSKWWRCRKFQKWVVSILSVGISRSSDLSRRTAGRTASKKWSSLRPPENRILLSILKIIISDIFSKQVWSRWLQKTQTKQQNKARNGPRRAAARPVSCY